MQIYDTCEAHPLLTLIHCVACCYYIYCYVCVCLYISHDIKHIYIYIYIYIYIHIANIISKIIVVNIIFSII